MRYSIGKALLVPVVLLAWLLTGYSPTGVLAGGKPIVSFQVYKQKQNGELEEMREGGIIQRTEKFSVAFKTRSRAYVYIFMRDATCRMVSLFPDQKYPDAGNPVSANKNYRTAWIDSDEASSKAILVLLAYKHEIKSPETVCKSEIGLCARGTAGTHKPEWINMNVLEIKKMQIEFR